jgi:NTE family protein
MTESVRTRAAATQLSAPVRSRRPGPTIGLALGSGSARGLAHIGVIRAIEESGIKVDVVAGASIGALIGAVYASGQLDTLEEAFRSFDWKKVGSFFDPVFPRSGLIDGRKIAEFVRAHVPAQAIEQLALPFCAVAVDLLSGDEVRICRGDLIEAVRASISIPGIFTPVRRDHRILVDGGLVDPVPVSAARALGADLVIAVDLNYEIVSSKVQRRKTGREGTRQNVLARLGGKNYARAAARISKELRTSNNPAVNWVRAWLEREPLPGMVEVLLASMYIMQASITESRLKIERPEVLIRPPLSSVRLLEFDRAEEMITIGYRSALGPIRELARRLRCPDRRA